MHVRSRPARLRGHPARAVLGRDAWRAWLVVYGWLWVLTLGGAVLVWALPRAGELAREVLHLSLSASRNPPPSVPGVASIAANNALRSVWPLALGLVGAQRRRIARALADAAVLGNLALPAALVGAALGGYGVRTVAFLPHVPFEWAGVALGASGWLIERRRGLSVCERVVGVAVAAALLVCAAVVESCLAPHR